MSTTVPTLVEGALSRSGYTEEEISLIYELARLSFESGNHRRAETLARGLLAVAPEFIPPYILLAIVLSFEKSYDQAIDLLQSVLSLDRNNIESQLLLASIYLTQEDYTMAGTMLGEASEKIRQEQDIVPTLRNFYQIQLARFESRAQRS